MSKSYNLVYISGITLVATIGGLLFGYDTAVISGTVESLSINFIEPLHLSESAASALKGFTVSSALIGCILGGAIAGWMSIKFGRKISLIISGLFFFMSAVGSALPELGYAPIGNINSTVLILFICYRIIGGIGVGMASMLSPMYIAEIAPSHIRGTLVSMNQMAIVIGMVLVYFINYYIALQGDVAWLHAYGWRWMFASGSIPAALFFILLFLVPESPRWLVIQNKDDKALKVLNRLNNADAVQKIYQEIKSSVSVTTTSGKLFAYGTTVVIIGILLSVFQQVVGINVVLYYAPEIFKKMGAGNDAAMMQTIIVGAVNMIFTLVAIFTVDRFGRKPLLIIGAVLMAISMICLGATFFVQSVGKGALIFMLFYIAGFALSWGPIVWVMLSEMFPNKIRGAAMSIAVAVQWVSNFLVSWTFPMMDENSTLVAIFHHGFAYWVYGLMCIVSGVFVWKMVPETKGKTLEEMEVLWSSKKNS